MDGMGKSRCLLSEIYQLYPHWLLVFSKMVPYFHGSHANIVTAKQFNGVIWVHPHHTRDHPKLPPKQLTTMSFRLAGIRLTRPETLRFQNFWKMSLNNIFHPVDERNPAPPGMYQNPVDNGINYLSTGAGFQPSTVPHCSKYSDITIMLTWE